MHLQNHNLKKFAFSAFAAFVSAASVVPFAQTALGAPINELARTSDGRWVTTNDAAHFGSYSSSDYISQNICAAQQPFATTDNGVRGTTTLIFSANNSDTCLDSVQENWQSTSNIHSGFIGDIILYDERGEWERFA